MKGQSYITRGGVGASLRERKRIAGAQGRSPEPPVSRRTRLARIRGGRRNG